MSSMHRIEMEDAGGPERSGQNASLGITPDIITTCINPVRQHMLHRVRKPTQMDLVFETMLRLVYADSPRHGLTKYLESGLLCRNS